MKKGKGRKPAVGEMKVESAKVKKEAEDGVGKKKRGRAAGSGKKKVAETS